MATAAGAITENTIAILVWSFIQGTISFVLWLAGLVTVGLYLVFLLLDYERVRSAYCVTRSSIERFGADLKILHPLPRVDEVATEVDSFPGAVYFEQARNGVTVRMALLNLILGEGADA